MPAETEGAELLDIAQRTLTEAVLPHLAGESRALALSVASAMRMVAREIAQAERLRHAEEQVLDLAPEQGRNGARSLQQAIRDGCHDADPRLHAALWTDAAVRASVSRPSALARAERRLALGSDDVVPS